MERSCSSSSSEMAATSGPPRAGMYTMGAIPRHGLEARKAEWLPNIADGELRLQSFAVTEPYAGSDRTRIKTFAVREGDEYVVNGNKIFIARVQHSELLLLLTRTSKREDAAKPTDGFTVQSTCAQRSRAARSWRPRLRRW